MSDEEKYLRGLIKESQDQLAAVTADRDRLREVLESAENVSIHSRRDIDPRWFLRKDNFGYHAGRWPKNGRLTQTMFVSLDEALAFVRGEEIDK